MTLAAVLCLWGTGCLRPSSQETQVVTTPPTLAAVVAIPSTATTPPDETTWQQIQSGLEQQTYTLLDDEGRVRETLYIVRLDPQQFAFDVAYSPGNPKTLSQWRTDTGALIVVNGGFFTENYMATGLLIVDSQAHGRSYGSFAGMVAIDEVHQLDVRWLAERPYRPDESLHAGLQSFPMLVKPGGILGFSAENESGRRARRTVIAQDRAGRVLLIVAPLGNLTLHQLSRFLTESDLDLDVALNLDGGPSTGLLWADGEGYPAFAAVPAVITVVPKTP